MGWEIQGIEAAVFWMIGVWGDVFVMELNIRQAGKQREKE